MKQAKRLLSLVLSVALIFALIPTTANAASIFDQRVSALKQQFPNGKYWNHAVYEDWQRADVLLANWNNSYGDSVTSTPCATHNGQPGYGQCDCNVFDGGMQCWGFANRIFYGIFGVYASNVGQRWDTQNVSVGDWIRLENENHSAVVLTRNGDYLTIVEGNRDGNCKIVWDRQIHISTINWFKHAPNWNGIVQPQPHTHAYTKFVYFWKAHPHYNCYQCSCGEIMENRDEVAYVEEIVPGKKATCTETGFTDGARCSICGITVKAQIGIPALGHTAPDANGKCTRCGIAIANILTYNANGGTGAPANQVGKGYITLSSTKPTRSGYTFKGWATSASATTAQYSAGASYNLTANTTLYAVWQKNVVTYTLTYNANGGTGAPANQTGNGNITLSTAKPTRSGYTFKGWATSASATAAQYSAGASYNLAGNATLYAVWQKNATPTQPTVKSVSVSDVSIYYKSSTTIKPQITADEGAKYSVSYSSSNSSVVSVDENAGTVNGLKYGAAIITCTVTDELGNEVKDSCVVTVDYSVWQWIIIILLFGWIWYI